MRASDESIAIARHINTFLNEYVPSQKTRSSHTLKSYHGALSLYIGFLETEKGVRPGDLSGNCFCVPYIEEWLAWLMEHRLCSPETCNIRLASIRAFLKYLGTMDISFLHLSQAASTIERRKAYPKKVQGMSKNAVQALLAAPNLAAKTGRRDLALMVVLYSTAARIDEVLSMRIAHLRLDAIKPYVTVIGKAAAGAVVGARPRYWGFCFRRRGRGRDEPCQIGQGVVGLHGRIPFVRFALEMKRSREFSSRIHGLGWVVLFLDYGEAAAPFGSSNSKTAKLGRCAAVFCRVLSLVFSSAEPLDAQGVQAPTSFLLSLLGGEGETRTPAPVTRPTPLAGAPRHQLEYFSVGAFRTYSI